MLGKSDETIQRKLDGFLSMESLDGILAGHIEDTALPQKVLTSELTDITNGVTESTSEDSSPGVVIDKEIKDAVNYIKSDRESGFDELSSQMSKSGIEEENSQMSKSGTEEGVGTMESSMLSATCGTEQLSLDQLLTELQSVAVDWRSFRHVHTCTCAAPFDCFTKKARCLHLYIV